VGLSRAGALASAFRGGPWAGAFAWEAIWWGLYGSAEVKIFLCPAGESTRLAENASQPSIRCSTVGLTVCARAIRDIAVVRQHLLPNPEIGDVEGP